MAGDHHRYLLRQQAPPAGLAAPLARCPGKAASLALEGFQNECLVRLDDPGQVLGLVEIESGQEPVSPPERGGIGDLAALRGLGNRLPIDPAVLIMI